MGQNTLRHTLLDTPSDTPQWQSNSIDPFHYTTQSQVAVTLFLTGHEPQNTSAISTIKHRTNWSKISLTWLEFQSRSRNIFIQHIGNSEKEYYDIHTERYVDGYCAMSKTVYQFLGCYYHGCSKCSYFYANSVFQRTTLWRRVFCPVPLV